MASSPLVHSPSFSLNRSPPTSLAQPSSTFLLKKQTRLIAPKRFPIRPLTVTQYSVAEPPPPPPPPSFGFPESKTELTSSLKLKLLSIVSGLNRGLAATEEDLKKADVAAKELEDHGGLVELEDELDKLQGQWKLIYSSAFSSRTLGGSRPGPPTGRLLPITLGQVFQRIDILSKDFDNIVELELGAPWPLPPVELTATLAHKFELVGSSKIKIIFEKTTVKTSGNLSQLPPLEVPQLPDGLRPPSNRGSGDFEVTYIDSDIRITRGDRGELRVFVIS
ncbi:plastid-lipid-associated protein 6, chloroplastic [Impatiens glandulifera]|uniref:plastid-lipid-associated protein 6, chloroplastic n=1 Tax=Impatiens glandulifera TaxID=253017 RepID=UPI001FB18803|nr:plastid-lipid-associated protein 6, chloroplastic [Impatiens glandulifera]